MKNTETHTFNKGKLFNDAMDRFYAISGLEPEQAPTEETGEVIENLVVITGDTISNEIIFKTTPLFFEAQNKRFIPNKIKRTLERYGSISGLKRIHPKKDVAIELCLIFVSNLANAYYDDNKNGWKHLHSTLLNKQLGNGEYGIYKKVLDFLAEGTKSGGPIVERSSNYSIQNYSYMYKLGKNYQNKGVTLHEFKTTEARNLLSKNYFTQLDSAIKNPIASNLIELYKNIELPTEEDIIARGRELVKQGYTTKKGKKLIMQNKRAKEYYGNPSDFSFIEDNLELFKRLTQNGYLIPTISEENAGGRVTDSFNLMPSWIRALCTIDGEPIVECDYSALHPNIAVKIYNGNSKYITHEAVAEELEMDVKKVKIEHLSFFNHKWENMYASPLFKYYSNSSPVMMENMYADKKIGHTVTTKKMFTLEVEIMTSVISKLNNMGIYVMYVYDALYTTKEYADTVKNIMNEEIINHGVYTIAK